MQQPEEPMKGNYMKAGKAVATEPFFPKETEKENFIKFRSRQLSVLAKKANYYMLDYEKLRLPSDVFQYEDELYHRAKESVETNPILPLIKDELRCKIQTRRLSQGLDELRVEFKTTLPTPLTEEEKARHVVRKHINKISARKCRQKKREAYIQKQQELRELMERNCKLKEDISCMEKDKDLYISAIVKLPGVKEVLYELASSLHSINNEVKTNK